jgi:hypothetical protein
MEMERLVMATKIVTVQWALDTRTPVGAVWCAVSTPEQAKDDKVSRPMQKKLGLAWMEDNGVGHVVVLDVPGHSRSETDLVEALEEFRAAGITAYDDMKALWKAGLLHKFWAFAHNRLGRSNVQHSYVIENIIKNGGEIYLHHGGEITRRNQRGQIALGGFESASYGDMMKERWMEAQPRKLEAGLPMNAPYWTHKAIYDDKGNRVRLEVNEAKRPMVNALIKLLLEGHPWHEMHILLQQRYGYGRPDGRPLVYAQVHQMFYNPAFWGHTGKNYQNRHHGNKLRRGLWVFDESLPLPEGTILYRNTIPALVTGELAEQVKDELRRRAGLRGQGGARTAYMFNGLLVCAECNRNLIYTETKK